MNQIKPNAIEQELVNIASIPDVSIPAPSPQRSETSDINLVPELRFDGSTRLMPWNRPEGDIYNWLTQVQVEFVEERVLHGLNGAFWARGRWPDGQIQSLIINYCGIGKDYLINHYGTELCVELDTDFLNKQAAAHEVFKALGGEDLSLPIAIREIDSVALLSNAIRDRIASQNKVADSEVDAVLGVSATLQLVPHELGSFAEQWSYLGVTNSERWSRATDQLRFSLYRIYLYDFVMGTLKRSLVDIGYNPSSDKAIVINNLSAFSHSGFTAERYLHERTNGWARSLSMDSHPVSDYEVSGIFSGLDDRYLSEFSLVADQLMARMTDELVEDLILILLSNDIPLECVGCVVARLSYLAASPGSAIKDPSEFIRNVCMPIRMGLNEPDARMEEIVRYTDDIMTTALGEPFDFVATLSEEVGAVAE